MAFAIIAFTENDLHALIMSFDELRNALPALQNWIINPSTILLQHDPFMNDLKHIIINTSNILVVLLFVKPKLLILEDCPKTFSVDNIKYQDIYNSDWTGFYDWKRDLTGNIIGVTHFTFTDYDFTKCIRTPLENSLNVSFQEGSIIDIYFSTKILSEVDTSGEQLFGDNRIYISDKGNYAISFVLSYLTDDELHSLQQMELTKG
ncbi:MAG: hypothetical protein HY819_23780 [Acidobacteria bacterium]|nr:hypothetical protein [Acidobacteriota bacterium]